MWNDSGRMRDGMFGGLGVLTATLVGLIVLGPDGRIIASVITAIMIVLVTGVRWLVLARRPTAQDDRHGN